jgi:hypothetical protein
VFLYGFAGYDMYGFNVEAWLFRGVIALGVIVVVASLLGRSN